MTLSIIDIHGLLDIKSEQDFNEKCLKLFRIQAEQCEAYSTYLKLLNIELDSVNCIEKIPYLPIDGFQASVLAELIGVVPSDMRPFLVPTLEDLVLQKHYFVLSIGFVLTVYYASNSINTILSSFNSSFQIELKRHPIKQRLIALSLSLVWALLSLGAIVLIILGEDLIQLVNDSLSLNHTIAYYLGHGIKWIIVFFMLILGITVLYNFGNPEVKKFN